MAKYWTPGRVKTRLGQSIGMRRSAAIHRQFILHLAALLRSVGDQRVFVITPADRIDDFLSVLPQNDWDITPQVVGDLGRRIEYWFRDSLTPRKEGQQIFSVLIGSDCPALGAAEIKAAFQALDSHDVVLGKAADGGYYLIGLAGPWRQPFQQLFHGIPWSSEEVFDTTVKRIADHRLELATLPIREDIDTVDELNRFREQLAGSRTRVRGDDELASSIESILAEPEPTA
jgi:rSAM/selenodomain-associated transferase 1